MKKKNELGYTLIERDDLEYERDDGRTRTVIRLSYGDDWKVSVERFACPKPEDDKDVIDRACEAIESDREPDAFADILIDPEEAIPMGGLIGKLGKEAKRRNDRER